MSNIDQRIDHAEHFFTTVIDKWAHTLSSFQSVFCRPILDIFSFSYKFKELIGFEGPFYTISWFVFWGIFLKKISPSFGRLYSIESQLEGKYRKIHKNIVHYNEEIAFYKGESWEKDKLNKSFSDLLQQNLSIAYQQLFMGTFDNMVVKYGMYAFGNWVVSLPVFGRKRLEYLAKVNKDPIRLSHDYMTNAHYYLELSTAIGDLMMSYKDIQQLAGYTEEIYFFKTVMCDLEQQKYQRTQIIEREGLDKQSVQQQFDLHDFSKGQIFENQNYIKFENTPVKSPNGDLIVQNLNFTVKPGMNIIIQGANGVGKTSLFRMLSSLWPLHEGNLYRPGVQDIFYVTQKPYLPVGRLIDQIIYPHNEDQMRNRQFDENQLAEILKIVDLHYLLAREGGFKAQNNWQDVLSGGEKQRMSFARVLYHKPKFAILDDCTSQVSQEIEEVLYSACKDQGITLFTVTHKQNLQKYHTHVLKFLEGGKCVFEKKIENQTSHQ